MAGANLRGKSRFRLRQIFWEKMIKNGTRKNRMGRARKAKFPQFIGRAGPPVSNAAGDVGDFIGQICVDTNVGGGCYQQSTLVSSVSHTWIRIDNG